MLLLVMEYVNVVGEWLLYGATTIALVVFVFIMMPGLISVLFGSILSSLIIPPIYLITTYTSWIKITFYEWMNDIQIVVTILCIVFVFVLIYFFGINNYMLYGTDDPQ